MLTVDITPAGGIFVEFVRVDIVASDDGNVPIASGIFEIVYTTDGTLPEVDVFGNPLGTSKKRRSPIKQFPIKQPLTLKFFARTLTGSQTTTVQSAFFNLTELTAVNEIHTVPEDVRNYTVRVDNGDIQKTDNGLYAIVYGIDKTRQDVREAILVENVGQGMPIGNRLLPQFGSALNRLLGQALPAGFTRGQIQTSIFEALTFLTELQREENVPSDEQIRRILFVNVENVSPTSYRYHFSVETVSGRTVSDSGTIGS